VIDNQKISSIVADVADRSLRLEDALWNYGRHKLGCWYRETRCSCGWDEVKSALMAGDRRGTDASSD